MVQLVNVNLPYYDVPSRNNSKKDMSKHNDILPISADDEDPIL